MKKLTALLIAALMPFCLSSCSTASTHESVTASPAETPDGTVDLSLIQKNKYESTEEYSAQIVFSDKKAKISGSGAKADNADVTINEAGIYRLSGKNSNGCIVIDCGKKDSVTLVLDGLELSKKNAPAVSASCGELVVSLPEGTSSSLSDGEKRDDKEMSESAVYCDGAVKLNGSGALRIAGSCGSAIEAKKEITVIDAKLTVESEKHAFKSKSFIFAERAEINVKCGGTALSSKDYIYVNSSLSAECDDGLTSKTYTVIGSDSDIELLCDGRGISGDSGVEINGNVHMKCGGDGIKSSGFISVNSGTLTIEESLEGMEACRVAINGGDVTINASDDGINIAQSKVADGEEEIDKHDVNDACLLSVSGGTLKISSVFDGIDSNGNVLMTGGTMIILGPEDNENGTIDYNGHFDINGGTLIAVGTAGMAMAPDGGTQAVAFAAIHPLTGNDTISAKLDGNELVSVESSKFFEHIVVSSPEIKSGDSVGFYVNNEQLAEAKADLGGKIGGMLYEKKGK